MPKSPRVILQVLLAIANAYRRFSGWLSSFRLPWACNVTSLDRHGNRDTGLPQASQSFVFSLNNYQSRTNSHFNTNDVTLLGHHRGPLRDTSTRGEYYCSGHA
ncbi:hypothetical protein EDB89DRAFT_281553 [Lactarius sanguifluus]|nr:hypothetical protein EDB89DRAFT_281553 [Lactarius sanguifluus]